MAEGANVVNLIDTSPRRLLRVLAALLICLVAAGAVAAQDAPDADAPPSNEEIRAAMQEYFQSRLRADLGLTDAQVDAIMPRIQALERSKNEMRRKRMETVRRLRRSVERGAPDAELERLLEQLDAIEWDQRVSERDALAEIDGELTARQRVRLRFFMPRFRREMNERVRELKGEGPGGPGFNPGRRPPGRGGPGGNR
jgi:Spy/CpxP family protein refolding chaperone